MLQVYSMIQLTNFENEILVKSTNEKTQALLLLGFFWRRELRPAIASKPTETSKYSASV